VTEITDAKRLLVDAVVIVASILMAFGIDAGWDRMQARAAERELLQHVRAELLASRQVLAESLVRHGAYRDSARVVADYASRGSSTAPPSVLAVINTFFGATTTYFETGILDGALSSGQLALVSNQALRGRLAGWPAGLGEFLEEESWVLGFIDSVRPSVVPLFRLAADEEALSNEARAFLRTREGSNLAELRRMGEARAIRDGEALMETLDELIRLLGAETDSS